jgi:hypothetical protein
MMLKLRRDELCPRMRIVDYILGKIVQDFMGFDTSELDFHIHQNVENPVRNSVPNRMPIVLQ